MFKNLMLCCDCGENFFLEITTFLLFETEIENSRVRFKVKIFFGLHLKFNKKILLKYVKYLKINRLKKLGYFKIQLATFGVFLIKKSGTPVCCSESQKMFADINDYKNRSSTADLFVFQLMSPPSWD